MYREQEFPRTEELLSVLESGYPVIMPCDTIYGIVGTVPVTERLIRNIKCRGDTKPFLQIIRKEWMLYSTSVNISGEPVLSGGAEIDKEFKHKVKLIIRKGSSFISSTVLEG